MEVVSGIIMGLDQDTERTCDDILAFIEASKIPMLPINSSTLSHDPLWRRPRRKDASCPTEPAARTRT